ncbi:MAG TPA: hypothetical protein VE175_08590 [Woeseiaceae bacterium]|nr:hypothetical protein [Woeseiaceae bacterium]
MIILGRRQQFMIGLILAAVMAATRFNHFGSSLSLPDASLAVFFIAGIYLRRTIWFPILIVEAGLMDWASIWGGVSDWCVTAAYGFLIPTYASLWFAGRWYARRARIEWRTLLPLLGSLGTALVVAFTISNASFYLLSGYFDELGWRDYVRGVIGYFPAYAGYTLLYTAGALAVQAFALALPGRFRPASSGGIT